MKLVHLAFVFSMFVFASTAMCEEITPSRLDELKMDCDTCHGVNGHSPIPAQVPSIAGKSERFIFSQLKAFEAGKRQHETMTFMGESMNDTEMRAIARYYSRRPYSKKM
mgnify:CR=1 FL=1